MAGEVKTREEETSALYHHEDFKLASAQRDKLYQDILEASHLDPEYLTMLALSALIALLGLLQNSAAVIIGAMLISPLMNPILAAALALTLGDWRLGKKTALALALSIAGAILITWMAASLVPLRQATPEIVARTNPNLLDLFIALLSGLAGTLALRSSSSTLTIIPGVAIAVAVVPPLAVVGFGLSSREASAGGAFLLFITNLVSIMIAASVVFLLMGFRPHAEVEKGRLKLRYRIVLSLVVLGVLSIPLLQTLRRAVVQVRMRAEASRVLNQAFQSEHSSVTDLALAHRDGQMRVRATVRTTEYFDDNAIQAAERSLQSAFGPEARLEVDQLLVTQGGLSPEQVARLRNFISGGVIQPVAGGEPATFDFKKSQDTLLAHLQKAVDEDLAVAGAPFRPVGSLRVEMGANRPLTFAIRLASSEPLEAQTIQWLAARLAAKLATAVELHGQAEIEGPPYRLSVEAPSAHHGLSPEDRQALSKLLDRVAQRPDLRLVVTLTPALPDSPGAAAPLLWRQVKTLLDRSRLEPSRWTVETGPARTLGTSTASPVPTPHAAELQASAPTARCEFKVWQAF
jgi:uncharacterized hydrophobic protein (TIGR00271 family)